MAYDIRKVKTMPDLIGYFSQNLRWNIDVDDLDDIEDISYDFEAEDIGLKEEAFAKISSLRQLQPFVDGQRWGIFCVEFDSDKFEVTALRKILSGLVPKRRNSADHAVWDQKDLMFICNWGKDNNRTIGIAHFEDKDSGLPQIKMISCAPAMEDFTQIKVFEDRLAQLAFPRNTRDIDAWRESWASAFVSGYRQAIHDSVTLTVQLAAEAQNIRNRILDILEVESRNGYVHLLYEKFRNTLIHDMTESQFADMYAQTVVYGLFSARCMDKTQGNFSAEEAIDCIPNTNPFLKSLMKECLGSENNTKLSFDELEISNVVELLRNTRIEAIIQDFNRQTGGGREDPVIHFYEEFLTAYDKAQKVQRGVYYTPQPVVNFMVRAVDSIIKEQFGLRDGLASKETKKIKVKRKSYKKRAGQGYKEVEELVDVPAIQVLDPATGTGTFLRQTILQIYENFKAKHKGLRPDQLAAEWNKYVPEQLLPRLNGFELMMAPYAVAHMKLAMVLKDTGYDFSADSRLKVYLTNSLEEPGSSDEQMSFFDDPLAIESIEANGVKKNGGINVVIGNPPYSGISSNSGEWITNLIEDYKYINGVHFGERKHWLQDDYVKFIRLSERIVNQCDSGILAFINNHAFIDNPTFRCMRWHLLNSFDTIYILNLHGNVMRKETSPSGDKDENVFDIQQGVSINIFVKRTKQTKSQAKVFYADLWGKRDEKYQSLSDSVFRDIAWQEVSPNDPFYFFIPRNETNREVYEKGFSIQELMPQHTTGVVTARDGLVISPSKTELLERIHLFTDMSKSDDEIRLSFFGGKKAGKYLPGDSRGWSLSLARKKIRNLNHEEMIQKISYRPFDTQYIYYSPDMVDWGRENLMRNMLIGDNWGLVIPRQAATDNWSHVQITKYMADNRIHYSNKGIPIECPLYLYESDYRRATTKVPNLSTKIVKTISAVLGLPFVCDATNHNNQAFTALDLLDYIYAVLHSNRYRSDFLEFLKFDFPRIPYPQNSDYFFSMEEKGCQLRLLHTNEEDDYSDTYTYSGHSTVFVEKPSYENGVITLSKVGDSILNVPEDIWNMYFGGYQPLQKWLKDRKNTSISLSDIQHYLHMITVLEQTKQIMKEIDGIIQY